MSNTNINPGQIVTNSKTRTQTTAEAFSTAALQLTACMREARNKIQEVAEMSNGTVRIIQASIQPAEYHLYHVEPDKSFTMNVQLDEDTWALFLKLFNPELFKMCNPSEIIKVSPHYDNESKESEERWYTLAFVHEHVEYHTTIYGTREAEKYGIFLPL